jgi:deoxycytidine triphosphate deaminase
MILSDREIKLALHRDHIRITPQPPDSAIASTSIDLTLHEEISVWTPRQEGPTTSVSWSEREGAGLRQKRPWPVQLTGPGMEVE